MGQKDVTEKLLADHNDVFADIINGLLFQGKQVVKPYNLECKGVHSQYKADDSKIHEQERDLYKVWIDKESGQAFQFALFGIENQTKPEKYMPARIIGYDGASYRSQLIKPSEADDNWQPDTLTPVITIILYFGKVRWGYPTNLMDLMDIREELKPYVNDYKINVFEISFLSEEEVLMFRSDFKVVADFFVKSRTIPDYVPDNPELIKYVDEVLKLLSVMTGDKRYEYVLVENGKDKVKTMCEVAERLEKSGEKTGIEFLFSVLERLNNGETPEQIIASGVDPDIVNRAAEQIHVHPAIAQTKEGKEG